MATAAARLPRSAQRPAAAMGRVTLRANSSITTGGNRRLQPTARHDPTRYRRQRMATPRYSQVIGSSGASASGAMRKAKVGTYRYAPGSPIPTGEYRACPTSRWWPASQNAWKSYPRPPFRPMLASREIERAAKPASESSHATALTREACEAVQARRWPASPGRRTPSAHVAVLTNAHDSRLGPVREAMGMVPRGDSGKHLAVPSVDDRDPATISV